MHDHRDESLTLDQLEAIESLCEGFEARWRAGESPSIDDLLIEADAALHPRLLHDLLTLELAYRVGADDEPKVDEYLRRFPDHASIVEAVFKLTYPAAPDLTQPIEPRESLEHADNLPRRFGQYELTEVLGVGGMGIVYRAKQFLDDNHIRDVALKLVRPDRLSAVLPHHRDNLVKRFRDEIQHAARLEHDHIVRVYDVGEVDSCPYFSMELSRGSDLAERLREGPVNGKEAARILLPIARALHFAHERQLVHRDVKPSNILLSESGNAYISDFGLSKAVDEAAPELSVTGEAIGTPPYMSPEQAKGHSLSPASDIYGLGATLYECLTGRPPFRAADIARTLRQVIELEPVPPRSLNQDIERDIETICLKCLEKQPGQRYETAKDLANDLEAFLEDKPIKARPLSAPTKAWRWCRRNSLVASLASTSVLFLAVVAVVAWVGYRSTSEALAESEQQLYYSRIAAAAELLKSNRLPSALQELENCPQRFRDIEWTLLAAMCKPELLTISTGMEPQLLNQAIEHSWQTPSLRFRKGGHVLTVAQVVRGPEGGLFVRSYDSLTGESRGVIRMPRDGSRHFGVRSIAIGEEHVALGGTVWELESRKELLRFDASAIAFSPISSEAAYITDDRLMLVELNSGRHRSMGPVPIGTDLLEWSADGKWLATASSEERDEEEITLVVWQVASGQELTRFKVPKPSEYRDDDKLAISDLAVDTIRGRIAASFISFFNEKTEPSRMPFDVLVWDVLSQSVVSQLRVDSYEWSPERLVMGVVGVPSGGAIAYVGACGGSVCVDFSSDGQMIAVGSLDRRIRLYRGDETQTTYSGHRSAPRAIAFDEGGTLASFDGTGDLKVWPIHVQTLTVGPAKPFNPFVPAAGFDTSAKQIRLATILDHQGTVGVVDVSTSDARIYPGRVDPPDISPGGKYLMTANREREHQAVQLTDIDRGEMISNLRSKEQVSSVSRHLFSNDDRYIAQIINSNNSPVIQLRATSDPYTVRQTKFASQQPPERFLLVNQDLAAFEDGTNVQFVELQTGKSLGAATFKRIHSAVSDDRGERIAVLGSRNQDEFPSWYVVGSDSPSKTSVITTTAFPLDFTAAMPGYRADNNVASFSHNDGLLAMYVSPREVRVHDLRRNELVATCSLDFDQRMSPLIWSSDDRRLLVGDSIFEPTTGRRLLKLPPGTVDPLGFPLIANAEEGVVCYAHKAGVSSYATPPFVSLLNIWERVTIESQSHLFYSRILQDVRALLDKDPNNSRFLSALGAVQYRLGEIEEAAATLSRALQVPGQHGIAPAAYAFQAMCQHQLGQFENASRTMLEIRKNWGDSVGGRKMLMEAERLVHGYAGEQEQLPFSGKVLGITGRNHWIVHHDSAIVLIDRDSGSAIDKVIVSELPTIRQACVSESARRLAILGRDREGQDSLRLYDLDTGDQLSSWRPPYESIGEVAFSPDGSQLAVSSYRVQRKKEGEADVSILLSENGERVESVPLPGWGPIGRLCWQRDRLAACGWRGFLVWSVKEHRMLLNEKGSYQAVALSDNAGFAAVSNVRDWSFEYWNINKEQLVKKVFEPRRSLNRIGALRFLPGSDEVIATAADDAQVFLWHMREAEPLARFPLRELDPSRRNMADRETGRPDFLCFDSMGRSLLFGAGDREVHAYAVGPVAVDP